MRVVLTGASGQLGAYLLDQLARGNHEVIAWSGNSTGGRGQVPFVRVDLADAAAVASALDDARPQAILHAAAISRGDLVLREPARAYLINVEATRTLAQWCARHSARLVYTSSDLVFAGTKPWWREDDPTEPVMSYGVTKRDAEPFVSASPGGLVVRISLMYGRGRAGKPTFHDQILEGLSQGRPQSLFTDEYRTPLPYAAAADVLTRLLDSPFQGIVHLGGPERLSRHEMALRSARALGLDESLVVGNRQAELTLPEARPADTSLDCSRLRSWLPEWSCPTIEQAIAEDVAFIPGSQGDHQ